MKVKEGVKKRVKKTIKAAIMYLTKIKEQLLNSEYDALQAFLQGDTSAELYSANKQQAKRYYKKVKADKEYPLSIRKDLLRIEKRDTKIAKYWARIPVKGRRGGVWVAIKPHCEFPEEFEVCESKLIRKNGMFFLHITIQKEVHLDPSHPSAVIACDIGEANPVTSVVWQDGKITDVFFGATSVRAIRAHYNHLRKQIGRKKVRHGIKVIKKIGNAEQRKVRDALHKATRRIVDIAKQLRARGHKVVIAVGDLKGVRKKRKKYKPRCRKNNRKIHTMPSYQVKSQLKYKSEWEGIPVIFVNEKNTSQFCWRCGERGRRKKRRFVCPSCGLDYNADLNGARNILNRLLGYKLGSRAAVNQPPTPTAGSAPDEGDINGWQYAMGEAHLL